MGRIKWTFEKLQAEALRYQTRIEFQKGSKSAYQTAHKRNLLDEICAHMEAQRISWTDKMLQEEALKYQTRSEFEKGSGSAYSIAQRRGLLDQVCSHMDRGTKWSYKNIKKEALEYQTRNEFAKCSTSAYQAAQKRGLLDQVCGHMEAATKGFDKTKPSILYYLKIRTDSGFIYKIGITNRSIEERYSNDEMNLIFDYQEWCRSDGFDIYKREQDIRKKYKRYELTSKKECPLESGWTECFDRDVLKLF